MSSTNIYPFNNNVETGLRMLTLLTAAYPMTYDLDHLVCFDYIVVHSGDIDDEMSSLHPAVPNRNGEILIRRSIIQDGLRLFMYKGLVNKYYKERGIEYGASEFAMPFLDVLDENYTGELVKRANWVVMKYAHLDLQNLRAMLTRSLSKIRYEFNLEIIK